MSYWKWLWQKIKAIPSALWNFIKGVIRDPAWRAFVILIIISFVLFGISFSLVFNSPYNHIGWGMMAISFVVIFGGLCLWITYARYHDEQRYSRRY